MRYAEVAVDAPGGHRHAFTYSIPSSLNIQAGHGILVPFGARILQGIVIRLTDSTSVPETKDISGVISRLPLISTEHIQLALWIADYYLAPLFEAIALMLPPGFERQQQIKPKYLKYLKLNTGRQPLTEVIEELKRNRAIKQIEVLELLENSGGKLSETQIRKQLMCNHGVIKALLTKRLIVEERIEIKRDPLTKRELPLEFPFTFTNGQQLAWYPIKTAILADSSNNKSNIFLLHGVTGSGKTEIYLQALAETVKRGKKGICLVPEISLTPQIIDRFFGRFPGRVAVLHSKLPLSEQYDEWYRIKNGDFDIVIGPRSAIFAPQPDLGLIIVDEEHEWAYKQSEKIPRYHARAVAIHLASLTGAILILGSATPDVETYYRAQNAEFKLVELKERVTPLGNSPLPEVSIINMGEEFKAGNRSIFCRSLKSEISLALVKKEQVILFINRRGQATFIECSNCGFVASCKQCSVALTYHRSSKRLICHHCRRVYPALTTCPVCSSAKIKYLGIGSETVEAACRKEFPSARVIRFDSDAVTRTKEYEKIVNIFRLREADILVGTQVVAKGLDFPGVSLVGVINADTSLNLPDFRAGERTFQLLCQVAGRAGRGIIMGKAIIQTFNPKYYAIKYAAQHNYSMFYDSEMRYRLNFGYPPFNHMVRLVYNHTNRDRCYREVDRMANIIKSEIEVRGLAGLRLIGPVPAYIARLRGKFQMQIILLGKELQSILTNIYFPSGWILDVDPFGMI